MALDDAVPDAAADPTNSTAIGVLSDARLVGQVIDGCQRALAALYDRHSKAVHAAALRVSRDSWVAAEVVQETFLALWNRAELFDPSRGSLTAWLQRIARNRTVDHLRAAGRHNPAATFSSFTTGGADPMATEEWLTETGNVIAMARPEPGPEVALNTKETRATIEDALAMLGPDERSVIQLAYGEGLSQSEIAGRLGWPIGTVKTRTRRALRRLRDRLEGPQAEPGSWPSAISSASREAGQAPCATAACA